MRPAAIFLAPLLFTVPVLAGDDEIKAAQGSVAAQLQAFRAGDDAGAYSYAAPNVKRIFPTLDSFMDMVAGGYSAVRHSQSYSFGKVREMSPSAIIQEVLIVGPDGKDYEAIYTLELQSDGIWRITGVSLRAASSVST